MKALLITATNYDDSEVMYPYYRMLEEGYEVDVASFDTGEVSGKKYFKINADIKVDEVNPEKYDCLMLPGGSAPEKLRQNAAVKAAVRYFFNKGLPVGAICHGPQILISADALKGKNATCYPGIKDDLILAGAYYEDKSAVVSGNLVTSRRPQDLPDFMREFIKLCNSGA